MEEADPEEESRDPEEVSLGSASTDSIEKAPPNRESRCPQPAPTSIPMPGPMPAVGPASSAKPGDLPGLHPAAPESADMYMYCSHKHTKHTPLQPDKGSDTRADLQQSESIHLLIAPNSLYHIQIKGNNK
jgi:hypothetical protein